MSTGLHEDAILHNIEFLFILVLGCVSYKKHITITLSNRQGALTNVCQVP